NPGSRSVDENNRSPGRIAPRLFPQRRRREHPRGAFAQTTGKNPGRGKATGEPKIALAAWSLEYWPQWVWTSVEGNFGPLHMGRKDNVGNLIKLTSSIRMEIWMVRLYI